MVCVWGGVPSISPVEEELLNTLDSPSKSITPYTHLHPWLEVVVVDDGCMYIPLFNQCKKAYSIFQKHCIDTTSTLG